MKSGKYSSASPSSDFSTVATSDGFQKITEREASLARTPESHSLAQCASIKTRTPIKATSSARALIQRVKLANKPVDTVEKRQNLPFVEAHKCHMAHQAFQFPPSDTSTFQKKSEPFANATKTFQGRESPQLFDVELKTKGSTRIRFYRDFVQLKKVSLEVLYFHPAPREPAKTDR